MTLVLERISRLTGTIELVSGLHIGAGDAEMHIGGIDNPVIKHPHTDEPYIPGSSLKGRTRSLLEWWSGALTGDRPLGWKDRTHSRAAETILKLFGISGGDQVSADKMGDFGPCRLNFWDCPLEEDWLKAAREKDLPLTEAKFENSINRISGTATNPRQTERVPAGARFAFRLTIRRFKGDGEELLAMLARGLRLLELDSLGGNGSRGYGKIRFDDLKLDGEDFRLPEDPFVEDAGKAA
ncbi:MAG: type III-A CRISPR-associated RAMP protein Csm3 [Rhodothalassiaceae bacterium]|nr:MAG: type III-A CRISPR-associated RAMP protein Csm3 [Rhodothalassiaceae bacterium]